MSYQTELLRDYWRVFGPAGVAIAARAKVLPQPGVRTLVPPGASHPVTLRLRTSDIPTYREVFLQGAYRLDLRVPPRVIVDAGANIGLTSVDFAIRHPGARIVAIEPEASNVELLAANTAPYGDVTVVRGALWNENTEIGIVDPGLGKWGFQTRNGSALPGTQRVQALTVDELMRRHGIDYIDVLKIDIEGAEKEVFADPSAWIDRVGIIIVELHERLRTGCNRAFYQATSGFDMEWIPRERSVAVARQGLLAATPQRTSTIGPVTSRPAVS